MCIENAADLHEIEQLSLLGSLDGTAQMVRWDDGSEVEQCPCDRRRRDAALDRGLADRQVGGSMDDTARPLPRPAWTTPRDLYEHSAPRADAPKRRGAAVTDYSLVADCQHGCENVSFSPQFLVANCVDATLDPRKPAAVRSMVDRILAQSQAHQLPPRHQPVLARRQYVDRFLNDTKPVHIAG